MEDFADNVQDIIEPTSQVENDTKAYSERLKRDREKIRTEERKEIAKSFGYESWDDYMLAQTNSKLLEKGLDPEQVKPVLEELIEKNPKYQEAIKFKQQKEEEDKQIFAKNAVRELNEKFGTSFKTIDELDPDTVSLWNNGMTLEKAFAANNYKFIQENALKSVKFNENNKQHLKPLENTGSGSSGTDIIITDKEFKMFEIFNPGKTREEYIAYLKKNRR